MIAVFHPDELYFTAMRIQCREHLFRLFHGTADVVLALKQKGRCLAFMYIGDRGPLPVSHWHLVWLSTHLQFNERLACIGCAPHGQHVVHTLFGHCSFEPVSMTNQPAAEMTAA